MKHYALQQFDYHVWANKKVCAYLQELLEEVYRKKMVGIFRTIYDAVTHIYVIDCNWLTFLSAGGVTDMSAAYIQNLKDSTDRLVAETEGKRIKEIDQMMIALGDRFRTFIEQHEDIDAVYPSGAFKAKCVYGLFAESGCLICVRKHFPCT